VEDSSVFDFFKDAECIRIHKNNQIGGNGIISTSKECEKLLITQSSNPLPLPTLKLSEPPGAVRPDGKLNNPSPDPLSPGQSPVNLLTNKSNSIHADEHFASLSAGCTTSKIQKLVNKKNKLSP
jgi:hypothetical protein